MNDVFTEDYQATIGLDFQSKNVQIEIKIFIYYYMILQDKKNLDL